jgi:hypothetical protein
VSAGGLCALGLVLAGLLAPAARAAAESVAVRVVTVLATNSPGATFDAQLAGYRRHLARVPYSSFRLLRQQVRHVAWGSRASFNLPGRRSLDVRPRTPEHGGLALTVALTGAGQRRLVDTEVALQNHRVVLVGGPRYGDGVLIILIGAATER